MYFQKINAFTILRDMRWGYGHYKILAKILHESDLDFLSFTMKPRKDQVIFLKDLGVRYRYI